MAGVRRAREGEGNKKVDEGNMDPGYENTCIEPTNYIEDYQGRKPAGKHFFLLLERISGSIN